VVTFAIAGAAHASPAGAAAVWCDNAESPAPFRYLGRPRAGANHMGRPRRTAGELLNVDEALHLGFAASRMGTVSRSVSDFTMS
jgi:hypothetical protein